MGRESILGVGAFLEHSRGLTLPLWSSWGSNPPDRNPPPLMTRMSPFFLTFLNNSQSFFIIIIYLFIYLFRAYLRKNNVRTQFWRMIAETQSCTPGPVPRPQAPIQFQEQNRLAKSCIILFVFLLQ